jgi:hypothetical protein
MPVVAVAQYLLDLLGLGVVANLGFVDGTG